MSTKTQISAFIDKATKSRLARFVQRSGASQAYVIEQALLHHMSALSELPQDAVVPVRIVVSAESAVAIAEQIAARPAPTAEMRALFDDE